MALSGANLRPVASRCQHFDAVALRRFNRDDRGELLAVTGVQTDAVRYDHGVPGLSGVGLRQHDRLCVLISFVSSVIRSRVVVCLSMVDALE